MKKIVVISVLVIMLLIISCVALVSCNVKCDCDNCNNNSNMIQDERLVDVNFVYCLTTQFYKFDTYHIASLIYKPENPTYINRIFNAGYGISEDGKVFDSDIPLENPKMGDGYDAEKNYVFIGWFTEPEYRYQWNFAEDRIYRDIDLYAKWIEI